MAYSAQKLVGTPCPLLYGAPRRLVHFERSDESALSGDCQRTRFVAAPGMTSSKRSLRFRFLFCKSRLSILLRKSAAIGTLALMYNPPLPFREELSCFTSRHLCSVPAFTFLPISIRIS